MKRIVNIFDLDGNFVARGFIDGITLVRGEWGWFSSLILLTLDGKQLMGWQHQIAPIPLLVTNDA